jgi:F-type H+-transporting ATPase subunit b
MIEIDWTLIAQIINFLVLVFVLNVVLFRPIRNALKDRQAKIAAQEAEVSKFADQSQGITDEIKENLAEARRQGAGQREGLRQDGVQAETSLLEKVKQEVDAEWAKVEKKIKKDMAKARETLKAEAEGFAQLLAAKILGRKLS